jgi:hypothetical protein
LRSGQRGGLSVDFIRRRIGCRHFLGRFGCVRKLTMQRCDFGLYMREGIERLIALPGKRREKVVDFLGVHFKSLGDLSAIGGNRYARRSATVG